jgi:hypothetical protein
MKIAIVTLLILAHPLLAGYKIPDETKNVAAVRLSSPLTIDGKLSEELYQTKGLDDFTQLEPNEGKKPTQRTEFWIGYDDNALYVSARLYDSSPDSITGLLARRDNSPKSDWLYVAIDSYLDRRTAYYFGINPVGSINDGTFYNDSWSDDTWDGIWERAATIDDKGWNVEMRIPYSQLRFSRKDEYIWGINVLREIARNNESDYYVYVPKKESGFVSRFAYLNGIKNISPPSRFEITPYVVAGGEFTKNYDKNDPFNDGKKYPKNIGADFKIGLGSNLTVDATINPDFGQVEVDPAQLNLSAFETYYSERRPFFVEGSNIFNFGRGGANSNSNFNWSNPQFFYSRRIGKAPARYLYGFNNSPNQTTILGAAKISGKLNSEQSLGILAAVTQREMADVENNGARTREEVEPLTFYGMGRTQYEFNDGYYGIGYLLTAVERDLRNKDLAELLNRRQYTLASDGWVFLDNDRTWVTTGWLGLSHAAGSKEKMLSLQKAPQRYFQRPDAKYVSLDSSATSLTGSAGRFALNKQKGNWIFNSAFGFISPSFDVNDLGYLYRADQFNGHIMVGYQWYEPDNFSRYKNFFIATARSYDFGGDKTMELFYLGYSCTFLNYWGINGNVFFAPRATDIQRTRGGPKMLSPSNYDIGLGGYSDSRNKFVFDFYFDYAKNEFGGKGNYFSTGITWKPTSYINFSFSPEYSYNHAVAQYLGRINDGTATATYGKRYLFGELNQNTVSASIRLNYTFTPTLSLQLYLQPYISVGKYDKFKELAQPNTFDLNIYGENGSTIMKDTTGTYIIDPDGIGPATSFGIGDPNFSYKSLRGNAVLRWEYLPGSTIYFVWTQSREDYKDPGSLKFGRDFSNLMDANVDNIFMIKATYWFSL